MAEFSCGAEFSVPDGECAGEVEDIALSAVGEITSDSSWGWGEEDAE